MRAIEPGRTSTSGRQLCVERIAALIDGPRPQQALLAASRALTKGTGDPDARARLRLARSLALWVSGSAAAQRELDKARGLARRPETRCEAGLAAALFLWRRMELGAAWKELRAAGTCDGVAGIRLALLEACLLRDEGRLLAALASAETALERAAALERADWQARVLAERSGLLARLGRWSEARKSALDSRDAFRALADPREVAVAGLALAALDLAMGDLASARAGIESARRLARGERDNPRALAEALLLGADLDMSAGSPGEAVSAASQALALFGVAGDVRGRCLAHIRHAHALVAAGRIGEALSEARRAVRAAGDSPTQILAGAELALGRVCLRLHASQAIQHFERARRNAAECTDLVHLTRLGAALARGDASDSPALQESLDGLTAWGDRRILALGVADLRKLLEAPAPRQPASAAAPALALAGAPERALVDAAVALAEPGPWPERWASAMRALRRVARWRHAALLGAGGFELRCDLESPRPLEREHMFEAAAGRLPGPLAVDARDPAWAGHPLRLLLDLRSAALAPVGEDAWLGLSFGEPDAAEQHLALVQEAARLLAAHRPPAPWEPEEAAGAASVDGIVGRCDSMRALFEEMERVAASEAFVHIAGETGTGKGKVALAIHERSRRRSGRFVAVNASSFSDELFEAEMFGHVRGAFTGAVAAREGYVAAAEGGTLFIDEVADLSPRAQAKLLRLLQEREYRRVGESAMRRADVRVISAANVDLLGRVAQAAFRQDLLYRLAVVTLRLPPLRERGDDVLLLARHFLRAAALRDGRAPAPLPQTIARALLRHDWPGNVRELENLMSGLVAFAAGGALESQRLPASMRDGREGEPGPPRLREALAGFESEYLKAALLRNGGNRAHTAREIGITRQALLGKMARFGLA